MVFSPVHCSPRTSDYGDPKKRELELSSDGFAGLHWRDSLECSVWKYSTKAWSDCSISRCVSEANEVISNF
jgi:hypothetical protein